jgi:hypothetical protein
MLLLLIFFLILVFIWLLLLVGAMDWNEVGNLLAVSPAPLTIYGNAHRLRWRRSPPNRELRPIEPQPFSCKSSEPHGFGADPLPARRRGTPIA